MLDAIIQFPRHPLRRIALAQQLIGAVDQVIIIKHPAHRLEPFIFAPERHPIAIKRHRHLFANLRLFTTKQRLNTVNHRLLYGHRVRQGFADARV